MLIFPRKWLSSTTRKAIIITIFATLLVGGGATLWHSIEDAQAACPSYKVQWGDTLAKIAGRYHTTASALAKLNGIRDVNRIYAGQTICVGGQINAAAPKDPLEWSSQSQVRDLLISAADRRGLPRNLVLAVAWQESGWTQHVIARDGGVGTMQLMPYTTTWLNSTLKTQYSAYKLYDNIELGTSYLRMLWTSFKGDLNRTVSAYNQGENAVRTRGIFNWSYVNSVEALMKRFS